MDGIGMTDTDPVAIFLPMLAIVALTIVAFVRMAMTRARAAKEAGRDPEYYRAFLGTSEPEYAVIGVRHYDNLFEVPVLFYAVCLSLFVLNAVTGWSLVFAWGYAIARMLQSAIHLTYNNPVHRGAPFVFGWLFIVALWVDVAIRVFTHL